MAFHNAIKTSSQKRNINKWLNPVETPIDFYQPHLIELNNSLII
jgi:hypothetical protein